ncbi:hypothetical protein CspeluHIS016_0310020 [Cutaneotrichosporon spelunceum]|uniref:Aurora kinase n=1 Tax=Cutaneotrichosporon spelunceum TaxID=1672016 RepID=A0AAD3TVC4_9TREE|nr:hypothetical protein CspeluHIS016_0310020 [Cutaneotrichosporon spelunceum]
MAEALEPGRISSLRDFDIGRPLGKGHFGKVYLARLRSSDFILALKVLDRAAIMSNAKAEIQARREIEVMRALRHPNIVRMYDFFADNDRLVLMLEYAAQGEMYRQLQKRGGRFSESRSAKYIRQVADGLAYLHTKDIIHRDIKPENLFIGLGGEVKIGDFGWSVHSPTGSQRTLCGTPSYLSPEMVLGMPHGKSVDIWALGVLAYELVVGKEPFEADTSAGPRLVHQRICRCDVQFPSFVSDGAKNFILCIGCR